MRGSPELVDKLLEGVEEQLWVGVSVGSCEDVGIGIVAIELGVLSLTHAAPGIDDFEGAAVERSTGMPGSRRVAPVSSWRVRCDVDRCARDRSPRLRPESSAAR